MSAIYYIQINEIQENIDEVTCIFSKSVIFTSEKYQKCYFTSERYQLLDEFCFFHKFPL